MTREVNRLGWVGTALLPLALALALPVAGAVETQPAAAAAPSLTGPSTAVESAKVAARPPRGHGRPSAEDRLQGLVKALKLDAAQEAEVRRALQAQREAIRRLTSAPPDPEVPRVAAIHAITDRTSERIRAVLNDEQKKLYSQPLPHDFAPGEGKPGVEEWLNALRPKGK